jgi:hypothetical protein
MSPLFALDLARRTLRDAVGDLDVEADVHRAALACVVEAIQLLTLATRTLELAAIQAKNRAA